MAKKRKTSKKAKQTKTAKRKKAKSAKGKATSKKKTATKGNKSRAKTSKAPKSGKPKGVKRQASTGKRLSALDAAAQVLAKASKPMRSRELTTAMAEQGLWTSPGGKTPWATLYSAMTREIATAGKDSRFKKVDRGQFELNG